MNTDNQHASNSSSVSRLKSRVKHFFLGYGSKLFMLLFLMIIENASAKTLFDCFYFPMMDDKAKIYYCCFNHQIRSENGLLRTDAIIANYLALNIIGCVRSASYSLE